MSSELLTFAKWTKYFYFRTPNQGSECIGTDLNRNYGYKWNHGGSSDNPCDKYQTYMGKAANSEPEVQNVQHFVNKIKNSVKYYQSLHSYGEWVLLPWGYTREDSPDHVKMMNLGNRVRPN